jgi:hypothetical protein
MSIIAEEQELRRELPVVMGNVDDQEFRGQLEELDRLLRESGREKEYVEQGLRRQEEEAQREAQEKKREPEAPSWKERVRGQKMLRQALRCDVARWLREKEYRRFSRRLAESGLLQWFCPVDRIDAVRVPSKSTLERYDKLMPELEVRELVNRLNRGAVEGKVGLEKRLDLEAYFSDATCVKAAIHFPVDWVLLRDGVRTLMKAILVIRRHGLKHRMAEPEGFLRQINRPAMEMTQSRRRPESRKKRKEILRKMKRLNRVVMNHARRYREKLAEGWSQQTDLKGGEVRQILKQIDGLIVDWKLLKDRSPGETNLFRESLERIREVFEKYPRSAAGDRGLWSQDNESWLKSQGVYSALCPRGVRELQKRMKSKRFRGLQKRRAQTEGRIGILKNDFLGCPLRSKGFEHRELAVGWAVLAHNLWLLAGRRMTQEEEEKKAA